MKKSLLLLLFLSILLPKEQPKHKVHSEMPKDFKVTNKVSNHNLRTEEILFEFGFEGGETFVAINENGVWDFGEPYTDENNNGSYDLDGGWFPYNNFDIDNGDSHSPYNSYSSRHSFNTTSSLTSPIISLPEILSDETESLYFKFWLNNDMLDADGNNNGYLDDYWNIWIQDMDAPTTWFSTENAPASSNSTYWCADENLGTNGGYGFNYTDYLDTPSLSIGQDGYITAKLRWAIESPAGASFNDSCTDGWDAINVRISSDNGETWELLEDPNLPYDFDCGMGWISNNKEFEEGQSLNHLAPGWGGNNPVEFGGPQFSVFFADLSEYANQDIIVRFAFGSDYAYATEDDNSLTGFQIDDIMIEDSNGILFNDDGGDSESADSNNMDGDRNQWSFLFWDWSGVDPYFGLPRPGSSGWEEYTAGSAFFGNDTSSDISNLAGHDIRFEFYTFYDGNMDGGSGEGVFFDDFTIYKKTEEPLVGQTLSEEQLSSEFEVCYGNDDYSIGDVFKLDDYNGANNDTGNHFVTLVNIDASWCPPCFDNLLDIAYLANTYADNNGVMIAEGLFDFNIFGGQNNESQTTCNEWGQEISNYTSTPPIVFDDSNYTAFGWFETDNSIPSYVIIDHNMQIRNSGNNLNTTVVKMYIEDLLDECGDHCVNTLLGDMNMDNIFNISDIIILIDYVLNGNYSDIGDLNLDAEINILDILLVVDIILLETAD
jgi:hypothetical protein